MIRVVDDVDESIRGQLVDDSLHRLTLQSEAISDLRRRPLAVEQNAEHMPPCNRLSVGTTEHVTRRPRPAREFIDLGNEATVGVSSVRHWPAHYRRHYDDSMLSNTSATSIARIWHGWTAPENADAYEELLVNEIVPGITRRRVRGHRSTHILRQDPGDSPDGEVEFVTTMVFDDWAGVVEFAGGDGRGSVVPPAARALLSRFDDHCRHYRMVGSSFEEPA